MTAAASRASRRPLLLGAGAVALVVVAVVATQLLQSPPPPKPIAGTPPSTPIVVSLNRAGAGPAHVGYPVRVTASALGMAGIAGLELWAGEELVGSQSTADPERPAATARWDWEPTAPGETILLARAFDAQGRTGQSSVVRITVDEERPAAFQLLEVVADAGETLASAVARHGGDLEQAIRRNPGVAPDEPFASDTLVLVPIPEAGLPPASGSAELASFAFATAAVLPPGIVVPEVVATVADCTLQVSAKDTSTSEAGYQLSILPPGGSTFLPILALPPADGGSVSGATLALGGINWLTLASYDSEVLAPSAVVPVAVPETCNGGWEGDARLSGAELVIAAPVDAAYFYLKVGDEPWQRVPATPGTFIEPVAGKLDAAAFLPPISGQPLEIRAWGWKDGALVDRGSGRYTPSGQQQLYSGAFGFGGPVTLGSLGFGTSLDIVVQKAGGEFAEILAKDSAIERPGPNAVERTRTFKWTTNVPGVTHLAWQILPYPTDDNPSLTPPFLVDSGTFATLGTTGGTFTIDFLPYLTEKSGIASATSWAQEQLLGQVIAGPVVPGPGTPTPPPVVGKDVLVKLGGPFLPPAGVGGIAAPDDLAFLAPPLETFYVRVIPMTGPVPAAQASNNVSLDIVEPDEPFYIDTSPPPPPPTYYDSHTMTATFFGPTGSKPAYVDCVRVVTAPSPAVSMWGDFSKGTVHCRPEADDDFDLIDAFESFVEWVGEAWDYIAGAYDWIQNKVIDAVLAIVPCKQIADQVADNGKETCRKIAKTALHAVMIAYGVPPELPNWDGLIAGAKGDLREFILQNAKTLPGVGEACDAADTAHAVKSSFPTCAALVDKAIDEAVAHLMKERSDAAAAMAGVYVPAGTIVEPDPRGRPQPPHFKVILTRTNAPLPASATCGLQARMASKVAAWEWLEYKWTNGDPSVVKKSGPVNGEPFADVAVSIPPLAPGQSITLELWLTKVSTWFEPDGWNDHYAQQYAEWNGSFNHAWVLLQKGAVVTGTISSLCASGGSATQTLTGNAWD